jgi:hypothetical protein
MPRKSAAAQLVEQVPLSGQVRPDAPYDLNDEEADVWRRIVGSLPCDYFAAFQWDLLVELCGHVVEARYVWAQLWAERRKKKPKADLVRDWKQQWKSETTSINQLMRAMRMTHQSVYHLATAANVQKQMQAAEQGAAAEVWKLNGDTEAEAEV